MSYQATVIRVMIATPGDVSEERQAIRDVIHEWNDVNSASTSVVLLAVGWDTHAIPEMGRRPQQLINDRVLKECDLLIGVFWTRLGTHTGSAESGTVEEIEEHSKAGKPIMIYFSSKPVAPESLDPHQYKRLVTFKADCRSRGLVESFDTVVEFTTKVTKHLQMALIQNEYLKLVIASGSSGRGNLLSAATDTQVITPTASVSPDAAAILHTAAALNDGHIYKLATLSGTWFQAGGKSFGNESARESARWQAALNELISEGLVEAKGYKDEVFALTHLGWTVAESTASLDRADTQST